MAKRPRILLLIDASIAYGRGVLAGLSEFARGEHAWDFLVENWGGVSDLAARQLREVDGVIGMLRQPSIIQTIRERGIPAVNVSSAVTCEAFPSVIADDVAIGRLAAEHLIGLGYRQLGLYCRPDRQFSKDRAAGFRAAAEAAEVPVHANDSPYFVSDADANLAELAAWMRSLPRPVAIFARNDLAGRRLAEAGRAAGLKLPGEVALLGCDDDAVVCELCWLPLSSIRLPLERIGFESAMLLARLLKGQAPPTEPIRLAPIGISVRRSTDAVAIADADLKAAVAYIHTHALEGIDVGDLVKAMAMSRRSLERRFRSQLGHPPAEEIRRCRIEHARRLLATTQRTVRDIATSCGFSHPQHLIAAFRRNLGITPGAFRSRFRPQ